jgi:hypothetical protein
MYMHTLFFNTLLDKRIAWDWITQNIQTFDQDECLTERKCKFYTDIELPQPEQKKLLQATNPSSFLSEEL